MFAIKKHSLLHSIARKNFHKIPLPIRNIFYYLKLYRKHHNSFGQFLFLVYYYYQRLRERIFVPTNSVVKVNNYFLKIIPHDIGISKELLLFKKHEPLFTKIIENHIKKGMTCIDIGANLGYYALLESKLVGKNGLVICFEPSPLNFEYLKNNFSLNDSVNVKAYNYAVGDESKTINFLVTEKSNVCRVVEESYSSEGKIIKIPLIKMDSFITKNSLGSIDFVRMDVEGYEFNAYKGMKNLINKFKPDFGIEIHLDIMGKINTIEFLSMLREDGYEILYYVPRMWDIPIVANWKKDVEKMKISDLINLIDKDLIKKTFPYYGFSLYLSNKITRGNL